jgi:CRP-like cAMP-binding protein
VINPAFLTDSPLFRELDETERARLLVLGRTRTYGKDEAVFHEGDDGDGLYIILKGSVRISKRIANGEEALAVLEPRAFFGEMALIDLSPRAADAIANEPTELFFLSLKNLSSLIEAHHQMALKVLYALCEVLAQRLRDTNEKCMNIFTLAQWSAGGHDGLVPLP